MMNKKFFKIIRIFIYIILLIALLFLRHSDEANFGSCYIKDTLGISCPSCGITRATKAILSLDFALAIEYNAYYTLVLFPIFVIMLFDDIICILIKKRSFVDIIFGEK